MVALLDVNVLIALFDPAHIHHEAAHAWFGSHREAGWATCPLTESGMVRILANPSYPGTGTTLEDAADRLAKFCAAGHHHFWSDTLSWRERTRFRFTRIRGHRQLTDVYLLALAVVTDGKLATFDDKIPLQAVNGAKREHLAVIPA